MRAPPTQSTLRLPGGISALVTGAAGGIGRAVAFRLAGTGLPVAVDAFHELFEFVGGVDAEQAVRPAVEPHDQNGAAILS